MNRRDFLATVLGGAAGAVLADKLALPLVDDLATVTVRDWAPTLLAVHKEAFATFNRLIERAGYPIQRVLEAGHGLGDEPERLLKLDTQLGVSVGRDGAFQAIEGAMAMLASRVASVKMTTYAPLYLPEAVEYAGNIGPLRLVSFVNPHEDDVQARFDVLGQGRA